jgi:hypothetical protein
MIAEWKRRIIERLGGVVPENLGSFTMDAVISRTEELRPDRLGPSEDDVQIMPRDLGRPSRTLGPW